MDNKIIKIYVVGGDTSYVNLFLDKIKIVDNIPDANVVLFTGGEDVYPGNYGEDTGSRTNYNRTRDKKEIEEFDEARKYNKFMVCVCRGAQLVTTLSGGSLIQHVTNHAISGTHKIHLMNEDVDIDITSTHHQMMYPFWMEKDSYVILAKSRIDLSTTYLDGNDRERSLSENFVEPEIVYYNKTNALCIQGHPEYMPKDSSAVRYINVLIREYLEDTVETIPQELDEVEVPIPINNDNGILEQIRNAENINDINAIDWEDVRFRLNNQVVQARNLRPMRGVNIPDPDDFFNVR